MVQPTEKSANKIQTWLRQKARKKTSHCFDGQMFSGKCGTKKPE